MEELITSLWLVMKNKKTSIDKTTVMLGHRAIFYPKHLLGTEDQQYLINFVKDMEEFIRTCSFTKQIEEYDYVITHWKEDWHQDHRVCYDLVRSMQRNQPMQVMYMESYPYCNKYRSLFDANVFVDTTNTQVDKENSILAFNGVFPHYWVHAVEVHDKYRGSFI